MIVDTVKCYFEVAGTTSSEWRLYLPDGAVNWFAGPNIQEIEMHGTIGGADQCNGGTADASSEFDATHNAGCAFDNDPVGFQWAPSTANAPSWIRYTFPSTVDVVEYTVVSAGNPGPKKIQLQYWDGASWITVHDSGDLTWLNTGEMKTFTV